MPYTFEKRVGFGVTLGWDSTGGSSYAVIGTVVDGDKFEAKWKTANTSLLSDKAETFSKTSYDPGELKFTINYDPLASDYTNLKTSFLAVNATAPAWQVSFPDSGAGSGSTTETFSGHIVGLSREFKKDSYLVCEVTIKLTGGI
jgi:hypothetical protein